MHDDAVEETGAHELRDTRGSHRSQLRIELEPELAHIGRELDPSRRCNRSVQLARRPFVGRIALAAPLALPKEPQRLFCVIAQRRIVARAVDFHLVLQAEQAERPHRVDERGTRLDRVRAA